jgi:transcriptional regulator with XRE-family HTH domain
VKPLMIQNYETGRNANPGVESLGKLALALGCLIEDLIDASK